MGKSGKGQEYNPHGQEDLDRGLGGPKVQGVIKRLVVEKGFGFIRDEASGLEYFFHQSGLMAGMNIHELVEGDRVEFVPGRGPKGPRAESIRVAPVT